MNLHYREYLPAPPLRDAVLCYWTLQGTSRAGEPRPNRVLPDGCMDLLFELGDAAAQPDGRPRVPSGWVVGAMEEAAVVWLNGVVDTLGVRFRPGGAARFLAPPAHELRGCLIPLDDLWGRAAAIRYEQLAAATSDRARALVLDELLSGITRDAGSRAAAALHAARMIAESAGTAPVRAIAQRLGISTRSLERRFEQAVGLSPRTARRVARFQRAVHIALAESDTSLAAIAVRSGYYDQAHFTRDFTALSGLSPAAWRAERAVATVQDAARPPD